MGLAPWDPTFPSGAQSNKASVLAPGGWGGDLFVTLEFNFLTSWKFTALQSLGSFSGEVELSLVGLLSVGLKARPPSLPLVFS